MSNPRARARPSRAKKPVSTLSISDGDDDDDYAANNENENGTPPPPRRGSKGKGKRRVSDALVDSPRIPLTAVEINLNDDAAERRIRRQSTKLSVSFTADADPKPEDARGDTSKAEASTSRKASGSAAPAGDTTVANTTANKSTRVAALAMVSTSGHQISSVAPQPMPSLQILSSNFEEWMKMATDNKINATNSWHFALIDYFHDMSLLRNELDNSINFQKASCTLDGCVKIWTSRVDSVATETGKLLSGLADDGRGEGGEDGEGNEEGGAEGEEGPAKAKRRTHRTEATLAKSHAQLQVKKFDLEFTVDPLFKKTSADFDEGGAMGLLMNHLGVDGSLHVVFDAGDCTLDDDDAEEDVSQMKGAEVDMSTLRSKYFPNLDVLHDKVISQTLSDFKFSADGNNLDLAFLSFDRHEASNDDAPGGGWDDDGNVGVGGGDADFGAGGGEDFFTGDQAVGDFNDGDGGWGAGGDDDFGGGGDAGEGAPGPPGPGLVMAGRRGGFEAFDPRKAPNERDLVMAMAEDGEGALDYFDQNVLKNWAGPEHWKMRKAIRKPESTGVAAKQQRAAKPAFEIDFTEPPPSQKELFAGAGRTSILLPGAKTAAKKKGPKSKAAPPVKRDEHLLPDDMHFSSAQLLRLFMKPKFALRMRRQGPIINEEDGEVDEHFWAQAAADQAGGGFGDDMDQSHAGGPIPFATQFFHDDYDDGPGFDDGDIDDLPAGPSLIEEEGDLIAATQEQLKRVRPEFVNYAKRAKRVDVRKLKENIWKGLDIVVDHVPDAEVEEAVPQDAPPTDPADAREFASVIQGLRKSYPKDKMEEISTSFCFICVLHLANERGLKLVGEEDEAGERKVGDIWGLKVFRDPDALPAA